MKSHCERDFRITPLLVLIAWLVCAFPLALPNNVYAQGEPETGTGTPHRPEAVQDQINKERPKGPIYIAIPVAYRYGLGGEGDNDSYCSPSIRVTNSSNATIEELIIGIDYWTTDGKPVGATITRYSNIKVRRQDTHYFYQLTVSYCRGIEGEVSVVRCVYTTGENCSSAVRAIDFGTIPLRLNAR